MNEVDTENTEPISQESSEAAVELAMRLASEISGKSRNSGPGSTFGPGPSPGPALDEFTPEHASSLLGGEANFFTELRRRISELRFASKRYESGSEAYKKTRSGPEKLGWTWEMKDDEYRAGFADELLLDALRDEDRREKEKAQEEKETHEKDVREEKVPHVRLVEKGVDKKATFNVVFHATTINVYNG